MIGITIANLLKANEDLLELVNSDNIYPYVANENTPLPLIIYTINDLDPEYDKDGWLHDDCDFSVISYSEDYANLQLITVQVRKALELKNISGTHRIILTGFAEGYNISEGVFRNELTFKIRIFEY